MDTKEAIEKINADKMALGIAIQSEIERFEAEHNVIVVAIQLTRHDVTMMGDEQKIILGHTNILVAISPELAMLGR